MSFNPQHGQSNIESSQSSQSTQHDQFDSIPDLMALPPPATGPTIRPIPTADQFLQIPSHLQEQNLTATNQQTQSPNPFQSPTSLSSNFGPMSPNTRSKIMSGTESGSLRALKKDTSQYASQQRLSTTSPPFQSQQQPIRSPILSPSQPTSPLQTPLSSPSQSSFQRQTMKSSMSSLSRLTSSVSRAFGRTGTSFNRNGSSMISSWSTQYVQGKIVPPITATTLRKEDITIPYPTSPFSANYAPFWWMIASFFIMFCAYSLVLSLLTSVYGTTASLTLGALYVFFAFSSLAMPSINMTIFKSNSVHAIFIGSSGNTILMCMAVLAGYFGTWVLWVSSICAGIGSGFVWVGYNSVLSIMARHFVEQDFLLDTRTRLHKRMNSDVDTYDTNDIKINSLLQQLILENGRIDITKLTDEQIKRLILSTAQCTSYVTSMGWSLTSINSVLGGFISWMMLSRGSSDNVDPIATARPLFILFFFMGLIANIIYYITYRKTPISMFCSNEKPLQIEQHDIDRINDNVDIVDAINDEGVIIHHSKSGMLNSPTYDGYSVDITPHTFNKTEKNPLDTVIEGDKEDDEDDDEIDDTRITITKVNGIRNINNKNIYNDNVIALQEQQHIPISDSTDSSLSSHTTTTSTSTSTASISNLSIQTSNSNTKKLTTQQIPPPSKIEPNLFTILIRSLYLMWRVLHQRIIFLSLPSFFQMLFPINLVISFFTANAVKPILGISSVPIIIMTVYFIDAATALGLSKFMKGFKHARWCGIIGSCIQVIFIILIMIFPHNNWVNPLEPTNLTKAWSICIIISMICGFSDAIQQSGINSALGLVVDGSVLIRSGVFSIAQVCKSCGSIVIFTTARLVSFETQTKLVLCIVILSIISQSINFYYHLPLDVDLLMYEYNEFVQRQEHIEPDDDEQQQNNGDSIIINDSLNIPSDGTNNNNQNKMNYVKHDGTSLDDLGESSNAYKA